MTVHGCIDKLLHCINMPFQVDFRYMQQLSLRKSEHVNIFSSLYTRCRYIARLLLIYNTAEQNLEKILKLLSQTGFAINNCPFMATNCLN